MFSHACVLGSKLYAIFHMLVHSMSCLCTPCHACVPRPRLVFHTMCYCSPFVPFIAFSCVLAFLVRTRSRPYGLCHHPYTLVHIKVFGSPVFHVCACLLLCFMLVLASLVLCFATFGALSGFVVVWLHLTPMRPCSDVVIWDASP